MARDVAKNAGFVSAIILGRFAMLHFKSESCPRTQRTFDTVVLTLTSRLLFGRNCLVWCKEPTRVESFRKREKISWSRWPSNGSRARGRWVDQEDARTRIATNAHYDVFREYNRRKTDWNHSNSSVRKGEEGRKTSRPRVYKDRPLEVWRYLQIQPDQQAWRVISLPYRGNLDECPISSIFNVRNVREGCFKDWSTNT